MKQATIFGNCWNHYEQFVTVLAKIHTDTVLCFATSPGSALAANVCKKITGRLTSAIAKQEDVSVQLEALDIMADMLSR